jgi:hypothetical protein
MIDEVRAVNVTGKPAKRIMQVLNMRGRRPVRSHSDRVIKSSAAEKSAADLAFDVVTTATAMLTADTARQRPNQFRITSWLRSLRLETPGAHPAWTR